MSTSMPLNLLNIKFDKWNTWRIINSLVIFLSLFSPFVVMDWAGQKDLSNAAIATGFKVLDFYGRLTIAFLTDPSLPFHGGKYLLTHYFLGLVAILLYCTLNLILAMFKNRIIDNRIWIISVFCLIALGLRSLWYVPALDVGWGALSNALLGYWLILIGLVSSIALEISYFLSKRI